MPKPGKRKSRPTPIKLASMKKQGKSAEDEPGLAHGGDAKFNRTLHPMKGRKGVPKTIKPMGSAKSKLTPSKTLQAPRTKKRHSKEK